MPLSKYRGANRRPSGSLLPLKKQTATVARASAIVPFGVIIFSFFLFSLYDLTQLYMREICRTRGIGRPRRPKTRESYAIRLSDILKFTIRPVLFEERPL